ncbi:hypothetical protein CRUP_022345 [Coryphaenoides rupestris]|nr:hypothetical protein CRUP_022345 [Coryphaenoides rupestris]
MKVEPGREEETLSRQGMVTKRIRRTEYMKKFKDPQWESYSRCYEELLRYRLTRRLLEHAHSPWFWSGSDSDSEAAESPAQSTKTQTETVIVKEAEEYDECRGDEERVRRGRHGVTLAPGSTETVPKITLPQEVEDGSPSTSAAKDPKQKRRRREDEEEEAWEDRGEAAIANSKMLVNSLEDRPDTERKSHQPKQVKTFSKATKPVQQGKRVRSAPKHKPRQDHMEGRHPFALYGRGERAADMAAKRTHNVGPAASTVETQRAEQRRAKSADLDRNGARPAQPEFNPWLTEYMSCFSARTR